MKTKTKNLVTLLFLCAGIALANAAPSQATRGPLTVSTINNRWLVDSTGKAVALFGSHTWDDFEDADTSASPAAFDFLGYVSFLKAHHHNVTILWKQDLPIRCGWKGNDWTSIPFQWVRSGPGNASDGKPKFDLNTFNQVYFNRLRQRVNKLQRNNIYAIVQLFDGLGLSSNRCSTDGYPFSGGNNINGIDDGEGTGSMDLSNQAITDYQDAYVRKVIDTLNDLDNVIWEISEEAPCSSADWNAHMIDLIHSYESTFPTQHVVLYPTLDVSCADDQILYNSAAEVVAPVARFAPTDTGKVILNDSDHSYYGMWTESAQQNRNYIWQNFMHAEPVIFMDPYLIYLDLPGEDHRNLCVNPVNGVCSEVDTRWENMRANLGYAVYYANKMQNLEAMSPQPSGTDPSSTGYCLYSSTEFLVYAPDGGSFTVNLPAGTFLKEWLNPTTGLVVHQRTVTGGGVKSFTSPFDVGIDALLYLH